MTTLTDYNEPDCCPECGGRTEEGFGLDLDGGEYSSYRFCRACKKVVSPEIEDDDEGSD